MIAAAKALKNVVCSLPVTVLLLSAGVYFTAASRFFPFLGIKRIAKTSLEALRPGKGGGNALSAFATALGGTVGIGSIFGMGYAIAVGGAGSIFWMWVCAFFFMTVKYCETFLAVRYREIGPGSCRGGAMYALEKGVGGKTGKLLARFFCVCCIAASLCCGNIAQTVALSSALYSHGVPKIVSAVTVALFASLIVSGGGKKIEKVNSFLVPAASVSYFLITVLLLAVNAERIPGAFAAIFSQAFGIRPAAGGAAGFAVTAAFREGALRGTFSHEAGMGSSPIAHASSVNAVPEKQGSLGVAEVFIDTFVVGTMTALCLIASGFDDVGKMFGGLLGKAGSVYLTAAAAVFAFAAVLSWCFYGEACVNFLRKDKKAPLFVYKAAVTLCAFFGCLMTEDAAYGMADIFNYLMMIPNMYLLFRLRRQITYG